MNYRIVKLCAIILVLIIGTVIFTHGVTRKLTMAEMRENWQAYYDAPTYSYSKEVGRWAFQVVKVLDNDGTDEGFQTVIIRMPGDRLEIVTIPATTTTPLFVESVATGKDNKDILVAIRVK